MKKIELEISDMVYEELRDSIGLKKMAGQLYGIPDAVCYRIVQTIEAGEEYALLTKREDDPEMPDVQS